MRIALDTNILVYVEGVNDDARRDSALAIVRRLSGMEMLVPVQALGELFHVLTRKARWPAETARSSVLSWRDLFSPIETTQAILLSAMDIAVDHRFRIRDAVIVAAAAEAGCRLLLSEDMHEGFVWRGMTIVNPFAAKRHLLLEAALDRADPH
jgi:predicted nucleic acid-binding protein